MRTSSSGLPSIPVVILDESLTVIQNSSEEKSQAKPEIPEAGGSENSNTVQTSLLAEYPQLQVMSPSMQSSSNPTAPFAYEALLTQSSMVQRLINQPYLPANPFGETADHGTAENEIF